MPASPPRFGAQARIHGLMAELGRRHDVTSVTLLDEEFDADECRRAMEEYCREVVLVPNPNSAGRLGKRLAQIRSLMSTKSFERLRCMVPILQSEVDRVLCSRRFDIVNLEFVFPGHLNLRQAPANEREPAVVIDSHNIEYDLVRQYARKSGSLWRRLYYEGNWRKLRREELEVYRNADGVYLCSELDQQRIRNEIPEVHSVVIPNSANVDFYQPRPSDPRPDRRSVVFFGLLSYLPNIDGLIHFVNEVWPRIVAAHPEARFKIIGGGAPPAIQALARPGIELAGFVPDLRPHLAEAAVVVVPLRVGGGTRLKIVEAAAMGKAIVSTTLGAEGIEAVSGRDLILADQPEDFAQAVNSLLQQPEVAERLGASARKMVVEGYSWSAASQALEAFYGEILERRSALPTT